MDFIGKAQPRVLILSEEIPQSRHAGSILLSRLFAGYGEQAQLADQKTKRPKDEEVGGVRRLDSRKISERPHSDVHEAAKLFVIGPKPHPDAKLLGCPYRELRMPLRRLETSRFNLHKRSLQALGLIPLPSHRRILRLLGDFRPDVVVTVMQNTPFICLADRTARKLGIPLVMVVHDLNEEFEGVFPWAKKALFAKNCAVYRSAARRLCVSPEMVEYLEKRYGTSGEVMYPNRSEELQPRALDDSLGLRASLQRHEARGARLEESKADFDECNFDILKNSPPASVALTLGYAGSVAYGYGEELVKLINVLREVGARIRMFSPKPTGILDALNHASDVFEICGYRPALEAWKEIKETCDAVILPYSDPAGKYEALYRTHFPSKLTEYLALGMPVIVSGPEFATGVKWAQGEEGQPGAADQKTKRLKDKETECTEALNLNRGHFDILERAPNGAVPCTTREELVSCLLRLRESGELRRALAERALAAGQRDFDPAAIRKCFINSLAATTRPSA